MSFHELNQNCPQVSVVIAVYRDVDCMKITLESVLTQTLQSLEVVLVDDGNKNSDRQELRLLAGSDDRIRLLENHSNKGLTASLIAGCKVARAPYIARIDNGDLMVPQSRLAKQFHKLENNPELVIVGGKMEVLDLLNNDIYRTKDSKCTETHLKTSALTGQATFSHVTVMFSRSAYEEVGGYNPSCITGQDTELWPRLLLRGRGATINEVFAVAPMRAWSVSVDENNKQIFGAIRREYKLLSWQTNIASNARVAFRIALHCVKFLVPIKYRVFLRYRKHYRYVGKIAGDFSHDFEGVWQRYRDHRIN